MRLLLPVQELLSESPSSNTRERRSRRRAETPKPGVRFLQRTFQTFVLFRAWPRLLRQSPATLRNRRYSSCARTQIARAQLHSTTPHQAMFKLLVQVNNDLWFYQKCLLEQMSFTLLLTSSSSSSTKPAARVLPANRERSPSAAPTLDVINHTTNSPISRPTTEFILVSVDKESVVLILIFLFCRWETVQLSLRWLWQNICEKWWVVSTQESSHWREEVCLSDLQQTLRQVRSSSQACQETREEGGEACCSRESWQDCQNSSKQTKPDPVFYSLIMNITRTTRVIQVTFASVIMITWKVNIRTCIKAF